MSVIYAKLKSDEKPTVILFNEDQADEKLSYLFNPPGLANSIKYDCYGPQSLDNEIFHVDLSNDQWLKIQDVYETDNGRASNLYNTGYSDQYANIDVIYCVTNGAMSFKKIRPSQIASQIGTLEWGDRPVFEAPSSKVLIDPSVDLYINKSSKRAYFKSFKTAARIARVLNDFYEETTQQHAEEALAFDIFNISEFDVADVGPKNRKRLARIKGDLNIDLSDASTVTRISEYADKYERVGIFENNRIKITSNAQLTAALDVISGSFYENEITGDVMRATSTQKLN
ncbi:MAG: hypothetical protein RLZZ230_392 [Candidatus Parcubacteria bacterium]|jgi:hypothetical protein